jgi:hypothetical protein
MGVLIVILLVAAAVGGVIWNKRNAAEAMAGVEFSVAASQAEVVAGLREAYCGGATAGLRSLATGVRVVPSGAGELRYETKAGDVGRIRVSGGGSQTIVTASTENLFVGNTVALKNHKPSLYSTAVALTHGLLTLLGVTPNAAKMKRFQNGLAPKLAKRFGADGAARPTVLPGRPALVEDEA